MVLGGCLLNNMGLSQLGNALALLRVKFLVIVKSHTFNLGKIRVRDLQGGGDGVEIELKNVASYVLEGFRLDRSVRGNGESEAASTIATTLDEVGGSTA